MYRARRPSHIGTNILEELSLCDNKQYKYTKQTRGNFIRVNIDTLITSFVNDILFLFEIVYMVYCVKPKGYETIHRYKQL